MLSKQQQRQMKGHRRKAITRLQRISHAAGPHTRLAATAAILRNRHSPRVHLRHAVQRLVDQATLDTQIAVACGEDGAAGVLIGHVHGREAGAAEGAEARVPYGAHEEGQGQGQSEQAADEPKRKKRRQQHAAQHGEEGQGAEAGAGVHAGGQPHDMDTITGAEVDQGAADTDRELRMSRMAAAAGQGRAHVMHDVLEPAAGEGEQAASDMAAAPSDMATCIMSAKQAGPPTDMTSSLKRTAVFTGPFVVRDTAASLFIAEGLAGPGAEGGQQHTAAGSDSHDNPGLQTTHGMMGAQPPGPLPGAEPSDMLASGGIPAGAASQEQLPDAAVHVHEDEGPVGAGASGGAARIHAVLGQGGHESAQPAAGAAVSAHEDVEQMSMGDKVHPPAADLDSQHAAQPHTAVMSGGASEEPNEELLQHLSPCRDAADAGPSNQSHMDLDGCTAAATPASPAAAAQESDAAAVAAAIAAAAVAAVVSEQRVVGTLSPPPASGYDDPGSPVRILHQRVPAPVAPGPAQLPPRAALSSDSDLDVSGGAGSAGACAGAVSASAAEESEEGHGDEAGRVGAGGDEGDSAAAAAEVQSFAVEDTGGDVAAQPDVSPEL